MFGLGQQISRYKLIKGLSALQNKVIKTKYVTCLALRRSLATAILWLHSNRISCRSKSRDWDALKAKTHKMGASHSQFTEEELKEYQVSESHKLQRLFLYYSLLVKEFLRYVEFWDTILLRGLEMHNLLWSFMFPVSVVFIRTLHSWKLYRRNKYVCFV